jgi:hypothetical protein
VKLKPTPKLRFVQRALPDDTTHCLRILQQYWSEDLPSYMADESKGEWRDVPMEQE